MVPFRVLSGFEQRKLSDSLIRCSLHSVLNFPPFLFSSPFSSPSSSPFLFLLFPPFSFFSPPRREEPSPACAHRAEPTSLKIETLKQLKHHVTKLKQNETNETHAARSSAHAMPVWHTGYKVQPAKLQVWILELADCQLLLWHLALRVHPRDSHPCESTKRSPQECFVRPLVWYHEDELTFLHCSPLGR